MQVKILGDFTVSVYGTTVTPRAPKPRSILALLAVRKGETVPKEMLVREIWGDSPPNQAHRTMHTYIYDLRRTLGSGSGGLGHLLVTRTQGYSLGPDGVELDSSRFDDLVSRVVLSKGRQQPELSRDELEQASRDLGDALALSRGSPLSDVAHGDQLSSHVMWLEERRRQALEMRLQVDMKLGRGRALIGELMALVEEYPLHERFHEILMLALARAGRRPEALAIFQRLRQRLVAELGLEPGASAQRIQQQIMHDNGSETDRAVRQPTVPVVAGRPVRLGQLPPQVPDFCGRDQVTAEVVEHLTGSGSVNSFVFIGGMPGVGKSALAVRTAHQMGDQFADGHVYVDVHDVHMRERNPASLFAKVLRALGIEDGEVPETVQERAAAVRSLVLEREILLVLDGVHPAMQVHRLLPTGCRTIITGRTLLHGVAGMKRIVLDPLTLDEGVSLLAKIAGERRVHAQRGGAAALVDCVGALPLAIRFVGERLAAAPGLRLERMRLAIDASAAHIRLADLERIGFELFSKLESSYLDLDESVRATFRCLVPLRGAQFSTAAAAELLECDYFTADVNLESLVRAGLLQMAGSGLDGDRLHALHPLVGLFAAECSADSELFASTVEVTRK